MQMCIKVNIFLYPDVRVHFSLPVSPNAAFTPFLSPHLPFLFFPLATGWARGLCALAGAGVCMLLCKTAKMLT